ncbi:MAG: T9SS type A sorting domain-containing protein, partial [Bacteroidetes bacterium]|nr:T9SS type A sorting domain-containing protein [Bacteroidota bacterium]
QQVQFNAAALPSGVYVVRLTSDGATRTQTITVVR